MGLFDFWARGKRATRARANQALGRLDDDDLEGSLSGTLAQLKQEVQRLSAAAADATAVHTRLQREQERLRAQSGEWRDKARAALQGGREDLARTALQRSKDLEAQAREMQGKLLEADQRATSMREQVEATRARVDEVERAAAALAARRHAATAQKKVTRALGSLEAGDSAFATLDRLEQRLEEEEAVAAAYEEIVAEDRERAGGPAPGTARRARLQDPLDDELRALEEELKRGGPA